MTSTIAKNQAKETNSPLLSIITVVFNNKEGLEKTRSSLMGQMTSDYEWIIIDGSSTDGTLDLLQGLDYPYLTWVSERDSGIYDAMNKGADYARGSYLLFLNSGDELLPKTLEVVHRDLSMDRIGSFHAYSTIVLTEDNSEVIYLAQPDRLGIHMSVCHSSTVIPRRYFFSLRGYNQAYKLASDYEFFLRAYLKHLPFITSNSALSRFYRGGVSDKMIIKSRLEAVVALWINNSPFKIKGSVIIVRELLYSSNKSVYNLLSKASKLFAGIGRLISGVN